jgi:hypothetical protein
MQQEEINNIKHGENDLDRTERFIIEGLKALNLWSEVETEHESDTEAWINLPQLGVSVFMDAEGVTRKSIGGREIKSTEWQVFAVTTLPATREEPEDSDLIFRHSFDLMAPAIAEVFALATKDRILNMIEAIGMAEEQEELKRVTKGTPYE